MDLMGKTVFITGAARGIGQATCRLLARAGADIIGVDLKVDDLEETRQRVESSGRKFTGYACDITEKSSVDNLLQTVTAQKSGFDVLVNNAGVLPSGPFLDRDFAVWQRTLDVNLSALMYMTYVALPHLLQKNQAHIVNIASIAGKMGTEGVAAYAASKHGVVGFSSALREELRATNVGVSWICPSPADTRMASGVHHTFLTPVVQPEDVARAIKKAIGRNALEVFVPGRVRWVVSVMPALAPSWARKISTLFKVSQGWLEARKELPAEQVK